QSIALGDEALSAHPRLKDYASKKVVLGIRPEDLEDAAHATDAPADRRLKGKVVLREALGSDLMVHFVVDAKPSLTEDARELAQDVGDERAVKEVETGEVSETTVVGRFDPRSQVKEDELVEAVVDTSALHFFDPETGLGI
ncbi:MAG TPA: TOBE domain-containing protein, partial [Actinomycetota bacterium]|nr:TOBE domain-containing protein [Actinomycetota bacterium]